MEWHMETSCQKFGTCDGGCDDFIRRAPTGRFFITIGHPGFNLPANNLDGYASLGRALAAFRKCAGTEGHTEPEESCEVCAPAAAPEPDDAEDCGHGGRITPHGCAVCLGEDADPARERANAEVQAGYNDPGAALDSAEDFPGDDL